MKKSLSKTKIVVSVLGIFAMAGIVLYGAMGKPQSRIDEETVEVRTTRTSQDGIRVSVKGQIPDEYNVSLIREENNENAKKKAAGLFTEGVTLIDSYNISLINSAKKEYQPSKDGRVVTVLVESDKFRNYSDIEVCHIPDFGKAEIMDVVRVRDDAVVLTAEGFSTYVFGGKEIETEDGKTAAYLRTGIQINGELKKLVDPSATSYTSDKTVKAIKWTNEPFTSDTDLSQEGEAVYAKYENSTIYLYTSADKVYFNANSAYMFRFFTAAVEISIPYDAENPDRVDTSLMENARSIFNGDSALESIGKDDKGNEVGVAYWDMSNVKYITLMFRGCSSLLFDCSNWNTKSLEEAFSFAQDCSSLFACDISGWNTENLTNVSSMFEGCSSLITLVLSDSTSDDIKGSKITSYAAFLNGCNKLKKIDFSSWDVSAGTDFDNMLACTHLAKIVSPKNVTASINLPADDEWWIDDDKDDKSDDDVLYNTFKIDTKSHLYRLAVYNTATLTTGSDFNLKLKKLSGQKATVTSADNKTIKTIEWTDEDISTDSKSIRIDIEGAPIYAKYDAGTIKIYTTAETVYLNPNSAYMFRHLNAVTALPFIENDRIDTSKVTVLTYAFNQMGALNSLDLSKWDTSNVTSLNYIFATNSVTSLDVSTWDVSNVVGLQQAFSYCTGLTELDIANWDTRNVTNMYLTFSYSNKLKALDLSKWNTSKLETLYGTFRNCEALTSIGVSRWDTSNVKNMELTFANCTALANLDVSGWNTENVTSMTQMFSACNKLANIDVSNWDTGNVTSLNYTFNGCSSLSELDVSKWDVGKVTDMTNTFAGCGKLTELDVSKWNTGSVKRFYATFSQCGITSLDVSKWDTSSAETMYRMFYYGKITELDVTNWDTGNVTSMESLFCNCDKLTTLDPSKWNTSKNTTLRYTFNGCKLLTDLDLSKWDTSSVVSMENTFAGCENLTELGTSGWDVSNVETMVQMFANCKNLQYLDVSKWKTEKVTTFSETFKGCSVLDGLDTSEWDTSSAEVLTSMFYDCKNIRSIEAANWDTSKVTAFESVFRGCALLEELDVSGWTIAEKAKTQSMLQDCFKLKALKAPKKVGENLVISLPVTTGNDASYPPAYWHLDENENMVVDGDEDRHVYHILINVEDHSYIYLRNGVQKAEDGSDEFDYSVLLPGLTFKNLLLANKGYTDIKWTTTDISKRAGVSRADCEGAPVYALKSGSTLLLYTTAKKVYLNPDCQLMFYEQKSLKAVSFLSDDRIDTSKVITFRAFFYNCDGITNWDLTGFDTSNVVSMESMFYNAGPYYGYENIKLDLSTWKTPKLESIMNMFQRSRMGIIDMTGWETPKLRIMSQAFYACMANKIYVSDLDTSNVKAMVSVFNGCFHVETLDLSKWDTSNVTIMENIFTNCKALRTLNVSTWDTSNVTEFGIAFSQCSSLTCLDLSGWDVSKANPTTNFNWGTNRLVKIKAPKIVHKISVYFSNSGEGSWGLDDNEDGILDDTTALRVWMAYQSKSRTYIRGNINTVSFVVLDSDEKVPPQTFLATNTTATVILPSLRKVGYNLDGWYTDKNCTKKYDTTQKVTKSFTLYAKWTRPTFTITFDPNGGVMQGNDTKTVVYGNQYGGLPSATRENYFFGGWKTPSGQIVTSRNIVLLGSDTTFTAVWTQSEVYYTVTFDTNGGSTVPVQKVLSGKTATKPKTTKSGFKFDKWYADEALTIAWNFEADAVDCDMTLYAGWKPDKTYKVAFVTGDGRFSDGKKAKYVEVAEGEPVSEPEEPERDKFLFAGWSADGATLCDLPFVPVRDMTLYAVWERTMFTVALDANGGKFSDGKQIHYIEVRKDETVGIIETPTREGYTFRGWYYDGKSRNMDSPVGRDMTIFAVWSHNDDIDETPMPDDGGYIPAGAPHDTGTGWTFKVIDGIPQLFRNE